MALPPMGRSALGLSLVSGYMRVAYPAASMMAFIVSDPRFFMV